MRTRLISLVVVLAAGAVLAIPAGSTAATFNVGSPLDTSDANPGNGLCLTAGGDCTLRAAIQEVNALAFGSPFTINLAPLGGQTIEPQSQLPAISKDLVFIDGCGVGRKVTNVNGTDVIGLPNVPASDPCVGLRDPTGTLAGLSVAGADGTYIQGLAITNFARGAVLSGADRSQIRGNWFGLRRDGVTLEGNDVAVQVSGRTPGGVEDRATGNVIGGESDATDSLDPACDLSCNRIVDSSLAGIDLTGALGAGDTPAGGDSGDLLTGTAIRGNWIGVVNAAGVPRAPNAVAVTIGGARETMIGGDLPGDGNVIAGNDKGVDQGSGTAVAWLVRGVYGVSPDGGRTVRNGLWNARLRGSTGLGPVVDKAVFGPADVGLDLEGPTAQVTGSFFYSPDSQRFTTAAILAGPGADRAFIGSGAFPASSCAPLVDNCNQITHTGPGVPGIWINGADDARIQRNAIGGNLPLPTPLQGPPIRIDAGAAGALVGDDDGDPDRQNVLTRTAYPAVEIGGGATGIVVGDNQGIAASGGFALPAGLFTDLLPGPGPGNTGPANGGIKPPVITIATPTAVGGTAVAGATIRVLQQQRAKVQGDPPEPYPEGYTFPTTPSTTTVDPNGFWSITFPAALKEGQKLLASQTTADGSSEYATPTAAGIDNPSPIVTFTSGPPAIANVRTATFTFTVPPEKVGSRFECSLDGGSFVGCASPYTVNGLDIGGHQLRVRATDLVGKLGPPAARVWIVQIDEPISPGVGNPAGSAAGTVRFSSVVSLPSAKACISRRALRVSVRAPKGAKLRRAEIRLGKGKVRTVRKTGPVSVSLKGLPRGTFVLKVKVVLTDGRTATGSRTYRTCAKKPSRR